MSKRTFSSGLVVLIALGFVSWACGDSGTAEVKNARVRISVFGGTSRGLGVLESAPASVKRVVVSVQAADIPKTDYTVPLDTGTVDFTVSPGKERKFTAEAFDSAEGGTLIYSGVREKVDLLPGEEKDVAIDMWPVEAPRPDGGTTP